MKVFFVRFDDQGEQGGGVIILAESEAEAVNKMEQAVLPNVRYCGPEEVFGADKEGGGACSDVFTLLI